MICCRLRQQLNFSGKMIDFNKIRISDYNYHLPDGKIAFHPLERRELSKMLVYDGNKITDDTFSNIGNYIQPGSLLVFNESKVVQARLHFRKSTGAEIEIFCLEPTYPTREIQSAFAVRETCNWKVFIGNAKRWKDGTLDRILNINDKEVKLMVERVGSLDGAFEVRFSWTGGHTFSEILESVGEIPLPPYIDRDTEIDDKSRYQTVYARNEGSVAAPTAGLHFTDGVIKKLSNNGVLTTKVTLHVGAGTFKPVTADTIKEHEMHTEQLYIERSALESFYHQLDSSQPVIAVGTTSVRTLESIFYFGAKLEHDPQAEFNINQWDPYDDSLNEVVAMKAIENVLAYMSVHKLEAVQGETQMLIVPGYNYHIINGMLTNFHQPQSTLLLLVSAFIGNTWSDVYNHALENDYRFLSYGDCCLFLKENL